MDPNSAYDANSAEGMSASDQAALNQYENATEEEKQRLEEEWKQELTKTEEEIETLRQVLNAKVKTATELKRKLGITAWREFGTDLAQGLKNVQESTAYGIGALPASAYQKTSDTVKSAAEKTTSMLGFVGGSISRRVGDLRSSNAFKSFEERVGGVVSTARVNKNDGIPEQLDE